MLVVRARSFVIVRRRRCWRRSRRLSIISAVEQIKAHPFSFSFWLFFRLYCAARFNQKLLEEKKKTTQNLCIFENILLLATQRQLPLLRRCQRRRHRRRRRSRSRFWILCAAHFVKITFRFEFSKQKLVAGARRERSKKKKERKKNVLLFDYLFKQFVIH